MTTQKFIVHVFLLTLYIMVGVEKFCRKMVFNGFSFAMHNGISTEISHETNVHRASQRQAAKPFHSTVIQGINVADVSHYILAIQYGHIH